MSLAYRTKCCVSNSN